MPLTQQEKDLVWAVLAMDAYSRGANPQLQYAPDVKLAEAIGTATFTTNSDLLEQQGQLSSASAVGFSASHYEMDGKTVISYRGTDFGDVFGNVPDFIATVSDILFGWFASFGVTGPDFEGQNLQHAYAAISA